MARVYSGVQPYYFNPRSHEGSDATVSIALLTQSGFQSSLPRGERRLVTKCQCQLITFQSSLPRGERLMTASNVAMIDDFNPRSHEGSDQGEQQRDQCYSRFQSSLPRGERPIWLEIHPRSQGFQSSLPRGERRQRL